MITYKSSTQFTSFSLCVSLHCTQAAKKRIIWHVYSLHERLYTPWASRNVHEKPPDAAQVCVERRRKRKRDVGGSQRRSSASCLVLFFFLSLSLSLQARRASQLRVVHCLLTKHRNITSSSRAFFTYGTRHKVWASQHMRPFAIRESNQQNPTHKTCLARTTHYFISIDQEIYLITI